MTSLAEKLSTRGLRVPEQEPIILDRKRIYIIPTWYGVLFSMTLFIMLIGSINFNNSLSFALTFLMVSVTLVSMLHAHRNLSKIHIRCATTKSVFSGQHAIFPMLISNPGGTDKQTISLVIKNEIPVDIDVPAGSTVTAQLSMKTMVRGIVQPGKIKIFTEFPLGLFHAWSWFYPDIKCIVYPAPEKDAPPPDFQSDGDNNAGLTAKGQDDFSGLRNYQPGDSIKSIAWKQSTRGDTLYTKQFSGGGGRTLWLEWDIAEAGSNEQRLSRICRWVLDCEASGIKYGLRLPDNKILPGSGRKHQHICLTALALFGRES